MALTKVTYSMIKGATLNVLDYGVVGNGVADDATAMQAAFDAASDGDAIYIPTGTYKLNSTVSFEDKQLTVYGDGAGSLLLGDDDVLTADNATGSIFRDFQIKLLKDAWTFDLYDTDGTFLTAAEVAATANLGDTDNQFTWSVNFEGQVPGINAALAAVDPIIPNLSTLYICTLKVSNSDNVLIDNVTMYLGKIHLFRNNQSTVQNCNIYGGNNWSSIWFENGGTAGVGIDGDWGYGNKALNNNIRYGAYSGVMMMRQKNTLVDGNYIYRVGESGVKTYQNNIVNSRRCYDTVITNNACVQTVYDGIDAHSDDGTPVERIDDYTIAEYAWYSLPNHFIIDNNYVQYGDIYVDGQGCRITNNTSEDSRTSGIQTLSPAKSNNIIANNTIKNYNTYLPVIGHHGINCQDALVFGNLVTAGNPTTGYPIFNPDGMTFGNYIYGNGTYIYGNQQGVNYQDYGGTITPTYKVLTNKFTADFDQLGGGSSNNFLVNTANKNSGDGMGWAGPDGYAFFSQTETGSIYQVVFVNGNGIVGRIETNGSATSYVTSSDYRLKEDAKPMVGALAKVMQLNPVTYKWKVDGSEGQGFIAHELQAIVPEAVTGEKDAVDEDGNPKYQGVDTSFLVATLTKAVQELSAKVTALEEQVVGLETK